MTLGCLGRVVYEVPAWVSTTVIRDRSERQEKKSMSSDDACRSCISRGNGPCCVVGLMHMHIILLNGLDHGRHLRTVPFLGEEKIPTAKFQPPSFHLVKTLISFPFHLNLLLMEATMAAPASRFLVPVLFVATG